MDSMYSQGLVGRDLNHPPFRFDVGAMPTPPAYTRSDSTTTKTAAEKKQITRNRASYSCHNCRRRKVKCDKQHPICGGCRKTLEQCVYNENARQGSVTNVEASPEDIRLGVKRRKPDSGSKESSSEHTSPESSGDTPDTSRDGSIVDRLDRLTSLVEALSKGKDPEDQAKATPPEFGLRQERTDQGRPRANSIKYSNGDMLLNDPLRPLPSTVNRQGDGLTPPRPVNGDRGSTTPDFDIPTAEAVELADPMSKMNLGYLSVQEGGRSRYVGSTFWAYISDEIDQLNTLLRDQNRYAGTNGNSASQDTFCGQLHDEKSPHYESDDSESMLNNSFHKAGDAAHVKNSQFRNDCAACLSNATDKSILLQSLESHPSRFRRLGNDVAADFPTQTQSHVLFRCWLSGVHGQIPLVYPPMALQKYESIWEWYNHGRQQGLPNPETPFMPLLYAIWYAGSVSISLRGLRTWFPGTTRSKLCAGFHDQITRSLTSISFTRNPSMPALAAFLMLQMILAKEEEPLTSSLYVSLSIRVAQTLGLHREPTLFNFSPWEVETRRRVWWQIVQNDCFIAIASGLPPLVNDDFFDTKMISEVKDAKLGTKEAAEYQTAVENGERPRDNPDDPTEKNRTSMVAVAYVVARGKYILTRGLRRLVKIHLGTKTVTKGDMQEMRQILSEVDRDLNEIIQRIPTKGIPEMGFTPDLDEAGRSLVSDYDPELARQPSEDDLRPFIGMTPQEGLNENNIRYHWNTLIAFHKWARIVLSLSVDKMYCISYAPFLKNAKSKLWPAARPCALRHCHGYMRKFLSLATDPAFQPFRWSWPGLHQPMHAAMIMLVDLYERPRSIEAPKSRAFIDKVFSMSGPDGGIVSGDDGVSVRRPLREGGREAWDMLRRLREKAWQRAGLDPDVLWTEDDQIRAGIANPLSDSQKVAQSLREDAIHRGNEGAATSMTGVMELMQHASTGPDSTLDDFTASSATDAQDPPASRPKTLQRLSTIQQRAPFKRTVRRDQVSTASSTIDDNTNNYFSSSTDASQGLDAGPTSEPVPPMAPPNKPYFNPPTAVSSNSGPGSEPSVWTQFTPSPSQQQTADVYDGAGASLQPAPLHPRHWHSIDGPSGGGAADTTRQNIHDAPRPPGNDNGIGQPGGGSMDQHFDWDQWDAVFGQHPVFDDMMEDVGEAWGGSDHQHQEDKADDMVD